VRSELAGKIDVLSERTDDVRKEMTLKIDSVHADLSGKIDALGERAYAKIDGVHVDLTGKIEALGERTDGKIDELGGRIDAVRLEVFVVKESIVSLKVWALGLYAALAASLLLVMARGFKWI
jgi:hypothetical protein